MESALPPPVNPYESPRTTAESGPTARVFTSAALQCSIALLAVPPAILMVGLPLATVVGCYFFISANESVLWLTAAAASLACAPLVLEWQNVAEVVPHWRMKRRLAAWWRERGVEVPAHGGMFVELGVAPEPRVYYRFSTNWDIGFLFLTPERLVYLGDLAVFSIERRCVTAVRRGFTGFERRLPDCVYIEWQPNDERPVQTFCIWSGRGTLRIRSASTESLQDAVERWLAGAATAFLPPEWAAPPEPDFAAVSSESAWSHARMTLKLASVLFAVTAVCLAVSVVRPVARFDFPAPLATALLGGYCLTLAICTAATLSPTKLKAIWQASQHADKVSNSPGASPCFSQDHACQSRATGRAFAR